jgi:hypothetical protein
MGLVARLLLGDGTLKQPLRDELEAKGLVLLPRQGDPRARRARGERAARRRRRELTARIGR